MRVDALKKPATKLTQAKLASIPAGQDKARVAKAEALVDFYLPSMTFKVGVTRVPQMMIPQVGYRGDGKGTGPLQAEKHDVLRQKNWRSGQSIAASAGR
ncbi:hypothetical protein Daesc_008810 [Daldinia eschscholtzii]|uniref:Uncharacterized protein n=1 Tax=Daldinia eschscholtzii TaxID=292717 RepID=A0AAX6ME62_9PEZI